MNASRETFEESYRRICVPRLVRPIQWWGGLVAEGWVGFEEATNEVMATAMFWGAGWLKPAAFSDLEHWVIDQVSNVAWESAP